MRALSRCFNTVIKQCMALNIRLAMSKCCRRSQKNLDWHMVNAGLQSKIPECACSWTALPWRFRVNAIFVFKIQPKFKLIYTIILGYSLMMGIV